MPQVTVFMPVYNAMPFLADAVESIRRQTLTDFAMIIVDDGSTDGSAEYLDGLCDPRIRVLHQAHQGPAVASNWALELCETEFFARMDADDLSDPRRLEEQLQFMREHPEVGLLGTQIRPMGTVRTGRPSALPTRHRAIFTALMRGQHAMCNPTVMGRTALLRQVGGYQADGVLEDWTMFLSMGERAELANLDRPLLSYRIHAKSTNTRHAQELRARVAYACHRARQRQAGQPQASYEKFKAQRQAAPWWRRALSTMEGYAMGQYQRALAEILGSRPIRGRARLAWAAASSPPLTLQRVMRLVRARLVPKSSNENGVREPVGRVFQPVQQADGTVGRVFQPVQKKLHDDGRVGKPVLLESHVDGSSGAVQWPAKHDLFGVMISATNYDEASDAILQAARQREPAVVSLHAAHALITASGDPALRRAVNRFEIVAPDGQPVRWALRLLYGVRLADRVYGPELMQRLCGRAAAEGVGIYLYGGLPEVIDLLSSRLVERHPGLRIVGTESPPFRPLTPEEEQAAIERINASGAGLVFIGLGAPKQDFFAHCHREAIRGVQVCVGAAFDFHAGKKAMAPQWMQRRGLEWLFRLACEPRRLWRRYLVTNTLFAAYLAAALIGRLTSGTLRPTVEGRSPAALREEQAV